MAKQIVAHCRARSPAKSPLDRAIQTYDLLNREDVETASAQLAIKLPSLTLANRIDVIERTGRCGLALYDHDTNARHFAEVRRLLGELAAAGKQDMAATIKLGMETANWGDADSPCRKIAKLLTMAAFSPRAEGLPPGAANRLNNALVQLALEPQPSPHP